jgi:hypothetical protein
MMGGTRSLDAITSVSRPWGWRSVAICCIINAPDLLPGETP